MTDRPFDYFVLFAEMRTGSNFLETNLNAVPGVACHGEAFNPHFIGYPNRADLLGITREERDRDPDLLLAALRDQPGLAGFRFFHDHDPRVAARFLEDRRCAKIVLTRNPLDSYVSWKIARETGQWKLTDARRRKSTAVRFDGGEFETHVAQLQAFQLRLMQALQTTGQTAFYLAYDDLHDLAVLNGLLRFLGHPEPLERLDHSLKPQNPVPIEERVANPDDIAPALARLDRFNLGRTPAFEPRRGPAVPSYVAGLTAPLLYLPIRSGSGSGSGPEAQVAAWLAALDGVSSDALPTGFTQKTLRQWQRRNPGHRSFTVVRHPAERAHAAFCERILMDGEGSLSEIRRTLRRVHKLPIPPRAPGPGWTSEWTPDRHRTAFLAFLKFLKSNLAGQTGIRIDPAWASQTALIEGMSRFAPPHHVVREDEMTRWLPLLAGAVGRPDAPPPAPAVAAPPYALRDICDGAVNAAVADVYRRDMTTFGFEDWRG